MNAFRRKQTIKLTHEDIWPRVCVRVCVSIMFHLHIEPIYGIPPFIAVGTRTRTPFSAQFPTFPTFARIFVGCQTVATIARRWQRDFS